jgi:thiol-disulfide isomerase/thioredoxin
MMQGTPQFTLYSRSYCHLCDDMLAALQAMAGAQPFAVDVIDVDADPALVARFDELVPVLFGADLAAPELCHYFLDHDAVRAYLGVQAAA